MKRWVLAVILAVMPAMGQQAQQDPNEEIMRVVTLKYADPDALRNLLGVFGLRDTRADSRLKVITLGGRRRSVLAAEDAIKQLDVPAAAQKDIELTAYFVVGDDQAPPSANLGVIPSDLQSTVATLKTTFPYKTYYLLDALSLRTRSGSGGETTGRLTGGRFTTFRVHSAILEGDGSVIRLNRLYAGLRIPTVVEKTATTGAEKTVLMDTGMNTEVMSVKPGQKLVVGRSSLNGPSNALFLVLITNIAKGDALAEPLK